MWKRVIRDYFAAFRWGKLKVGAAVGNWWLFVYFLFVLPVLWRTYERENAMLQYLAIMVPFLFSLFVISAYPAVLPKMMYLCPVSPGERQEYMNQSRIVRIVIPMCLSLIGIVVLQVLAIGHWMLGIAVLVNQLQFSIVAASIVNQNGYGALDANGKRVVDMDSKGGILMGAILVVALITSFIHAEVAWDNTVPWWGWLMLIGIPTAMELPIVIWFCRHWPESVEKALVYETAVDIVVKKE